MTGVGPYLDTNDYTAVMPGDAAVVEVVAHAERLCLNSIVLGELLGGFAAGTREAKNRAELARFLDSPRVEMLPPLVDRCQCTGTWRWTADARAHFAQIDGLRCGQKLGDFLP